MGIAALSVAASAQAGTILNFSGSVDNGGFIIPLSPPLDDRQMYLSGSATFAADITDGTYGLADLAGFSLDLRRAVHVIGMPPGLFVTADYSFTLGDLTSFSLTLVGGVATAGSWTTALLAPYAYTSSGFMPETSVDLDSGADPSLTFYQMVGNVKTAVARADFDQVYISTGAVPEPASWAMMIAGFMIAGAGLRQRSARVRVRFA